MMGSSHSGIFKAEGQACTCEEEVGEDDRDAMPTSGDPVSLDASSSSLASASFAASSNEKESVSDDSDTASASEVQDSSHSAALTSGSSVKLTVGLKKKMLRGFQNVSFNTHLAFVFAALTGN